jgi:hypothetical protein
MTTSVKVGVALGVVCALLVGGVVGCQPAGSADKKNDSGGLSQSEATEIRTSLDRIAAMNASKAVILAAHKAAGETETFPGPNGFKDFVRPHLAPADASAPDAFVWTFPGGSLLDIESIATTEIGYVPSPEGRAVAYADGSVKMKED